MIKAVIVSGGERIVVLGLTGENMARLMADEPIPIELGELGLPKQRIFIVGGVSEEAIGESLVAHFGQPRERRGP